MQKLIFPVCSRFSYELKQQIKVLSGSWHCEAVYQPFTAEWNSHGWKLISSHGRNPRSGRPPKSNWSLGQMTSSQICFLLSNMSCWGFPRWDSPRRIEVLTGDGAQSLQRGWWTHEPNLLIITSKSFLPTHREHSTFLLFFKKGNVAIFTHFSV